jgi:hypothetical protein
MIQASVQVMCLCLFMCVQCACTQLLTHHQFLEIHTVFEVVEFLYVAGQTLRLMQSAVHTLTKLYVYVNMYVCIYVCM